MLGAGYLRETTSNGNLVMYERGPRAPVIEGMISAADSDRGARSALTPGRVHRQDFKWRVERDPKKPEPKWERSWPSSGVWYYQTTVHFNGKRYTVRENRGRTKQSLTIYCPEEWVLDPASAAEVQRVTLFEAGQVLRSFGSEHGYSLLGNLTPLQPAEVGFSAPELPKYGRAGQDPIWVDGSGHDGNELETQMGPAAEAFLKAPRFQEKTSARLDVLEKAWAVERLDWERMARIMEDAAAVMQADKAVSLGLMENQANQHLQGRRALPSPPSPPSPRYDLI